MKYLIPMILASSILMAEQPCLSIRDFKPQHVEQILDGTFDGILEVHEGDELPLSFQLSGDTLAFKVAPEGAVVIALRTFYISIEDKEFYFSEDKENWLPCWEFFTGNISTGIGSAIEPFGTIGLQADVR